MNLRKDKAQRLEYVARLYYEENNMQSEIAKKMGVSRPLISRMLQEARELGIVEINIRSLSKESTSVLAKAKEEFGLAGGVLISPTTSDKALNQLVAGAVMQHIRTLGGGRLGLGWGHCIGDLATMLEQQPPTADVLTDICPMVGNSGISIRNYHSNENVRIVAHHTIAQPHYLHTPAFAESQQDLALFCQTENYKAVFRQWQQLNIALVNIGNYPSSPDFASVARYGALLSQRRAVGRLISYYFNENGEIIHSDDDYAMQIPLSLLSHCPNVVGVCSANVSKHALLGALRTGLITHIIASEQLVCDVLEINKTS